MLKLFCFGTPRFEYEGQPVEIRLRKPLALLVYLAVTGRPHSRDTLAELFWPGYGSSDARANLRRGLSDLNRSLPNEWIESNRQTIALRQQVKLWVDVADFRQLAKQGGEEPNFHDLERAIALYQGDFLAGFSLPDAPEFEAWQREEADALTKEVAGVLDLLATAYASQGDYERALVHTRRRLGLDPFDESAHRALMRLYAWSGQRAAALRQYDACALLLSEEMQLDPQPETTALWREIQADGARARQQVADDNTQSPPRNTPHNLPAQATPSPCAIRPWPTRAGSTMWPGGNWRQSLQRSRRRTSPRRKNEERLWICGRRRRNCWQW